METIECLEQLSKFLMKDFSKLHVVVMPDFFLDRLLTLEWDNTVFSRKVGDIIDTKGGSIDNIRQTDQRGGNAVNTGSALSALGVRVTPIVCTNKLGAQLIRFYLDPAKHDLSHVKIFENASMTTALEFPGKKEEKINVMLRDTGSLADFCPQHINQDDLQVIDEADYVCIFNWAGTKNFGTTLTETVFRRVKENGIGKTYLDTADPRPNTRDIPKLVRRVLQRDFLDILSLNENEAITYASYLGKMDRKTEKGSSSDDLAKKGAEILANQLSARVDLHTANFSASLRGDESVTVPSLQIPVLRATGSGDAWNAGNILGDAPELSDESRLTLANMVAAYYISEPSGKHPTKEQLLDFCEKLKKSSN